MTCLKPALCAWEQPQLNPMKLLNDTSAPSPSHPTGSIPNLHITTDLLAMLIPELPKKYPHQFLKIDVEALTNPRVSFSAVNGSSVTVGHVVTLPW